MKTIYEEVKEELIMKEIEKTRVQIIDELDQAIEDVIKELTNKPLINLPSEEEFNWHIKLTNRLDTLITYRRKSVKIESFKDLNMEELAKVIIGY